jgi:hypothetical protein
MNVWFAAGFMTRPLEIRRAESHREQLLKIYRTFGSALYAGWTKLTSAKWNNYTLKTFIFEEDNA